MCESNLVVKVKYEEDQVGERKILIERKQTKQLTNLNSRTRCTQTNYGGTPLQPAEMSTQKKKQILFFE